MIDHLITHRMMFGNMILVDSPVWVERYNRALGMLTGRRTALPEFHIDISGFSPEIADELGDDNYLKPKNGHRQFIILTSQQASSPMLTGDFSFLREGLKDFIRKNETAVTTITAYDVLLGDIDDSAWRVKTPADLVKVRSVRFSAGSLSRGCADSAKMKRLADRFMGEPEGWADEVLISEMVQLAKKGGDFVRNPVQIEDLTIRTDAFHTPLFGGVYVLNTEFVRMMVFRDPAQRAKAEVPGVSLFDLRSTRNLFSTLEQAGLVSSLLTAGPEVLPALQRKKEYAMIACLCRHREGAATDLDARSLRITMSREGAEPSPVLIALAAACKDVESGVMPDPVNTADAAWPYLHRAAHGPAEAVVNAILAEAAPDDPAPLFALNKASFFRTYARWNADQKRCFTQRIAEDYMARKPLFRVETFGHRTLLRNPEEKTKENTPEPAFSV